MNVFTWILGISATLGLGWVAWQTRQDSLGERCLDAGLIALLGGLLGGRAAFVAQKALYFRAHPLEAFNLGAGGFTGWGALAGGLLALCLYAAIARISLGRLTDRLLPFLAVMAVSGWLAGWQAGAGYGALASGQWWAIPTRDEWGRIAMRFPLQPLGALLTLVWCAWADGRRQSRSIPGQAFSLALLGLGLVQFGLAYFQADPAATWNGLRFEAWAAVGLILLGLVGFLWATLAHKRVFLREEKAA